MLGKAPDTRSLIATYGADLSKLHSEDTQDIVKSERYQALFGERAYSAHTVEIDVDTSSKSYWRIEGYKGSVTAVGVGGGGVGRSFELVIVDDPYKNQQEAKNPEIRKKVSKWFDNVVMSRRKKGTAIVLVHTRWDRDDLIGEQERLMVTDAKSLQWRIVSIPAYPLEAHEYALDEGLQKEAMKDGVYKPMADPLEREAGSKQSFCPQLFPDDHLETTRIRLEAKGESMVWFATYMQQPRPEMGEFFGRGGIKLVDEAPEGLRWYRYIDLALGKSKRSDLNTCAAVAVDGVANIYARDMIRIRQYANFLKVIKEVMLFEKGTIWGVESNLFQELAFLELINDPELIGIPIFPIIASDDKESDARVLQARASVGKLFFVRGDWNEEAVNEFIEFPDGAHDDQVDTIARGVKLSVVLANVLNGPPVGTLVIDDRVEISPY
jgi:predicted phage terminase large subunit-like protein